MHSLVILIALGLQETLDDWVRRYLAEPDKNAGLVEKIAAQPLEEIARAIRSSRVYAKRDGGVVERAATNTHDRSVKVTYLLYVPDHDPAQRYPLLVSLHGQSSCAKNHIGAWLSHVSEIPGLFLLVPDAGKGGWGRSRLGYGNIFGPLREVLACYPIDPNRVFIDGGSMGGHGTFQCAAHFPDLFAGVAPRIGGPEFVKQPDGAVQACFLENLRNVPVYWIVGVRDEKVPIEWIRVAKKWMDELKLDVVYRELDGGHEWFSTENVKVLEWMREHKRNPYPAAVHWVTRERIFPRVYWVEITGFASSGKEILRQTHVGLEGEKLEERLTFVNPVEVRAKIDRATNSVRISASHVDALRIYLNDEMLDLDKEVVVFVDGNQPVKRKVARLPRVLLESAARDREMLFTGSIDVRVK